MAVQPMTRSTTRPTTPTAADPVPRQRPDRCPGVLRPWPAEDGALLRVRLVGGRLDRAQLAGLEALARDHGDGSLYLTARANLQVRGVALPVPAEVPDRVAALGLLPSAAHERVRNIMVSPLTGRIGGRADLRPVAGAVDTALCADPDLAGLPGKFLFALDDRGDLAQHRADLAAVAVDRGAARLWAGGLPGEVVALEEVPGRLVRLARRFLARRGRGAGAAWHVRELPGGGAALGSFGDRPVAGEPWAAGTPRDDVPDWGPLRQDDGRSARHIPVPGGQVTPALLEHLLAAAGEEVLVTPWRSLLLPDLGPGA